MSSRVIDRRWRKTPLLFANDTGSVEDDRRAHERRQNPRFSVHLWVEQRSDGRGAAELLYCPELSASGLFLVRPEPLELGTSLGLLFTPPGHVDPVRAQGRVASIRITPDDPDAPAGHGVYFTVIPEEDRLRLIDYLERCAARAGHDLPIPG